MMSTILPQNLQIRSASRDDAQAIADINIEHELAETGRTEITVSDVFELWDSEHMNLATNTGAITTQGGELVAYTGVATTNRGVMLDVHTAVRPSYQNQPLILAYLHQFAEERARSLCAENPVLLRQMYTWSFTPTTRQSLEQKGYTVESSEYRMEITFLRTQRGRGIARQLLLTAFNQYYRRGIRRVQLSVDSESQTGSHQHLEFLPEDGSRYEIVGGELYKSKQPDM